MSLHYTRKMKFVFLWSQITPNYITNNIQAIQPPPISLTIDYAHDNMMHEIYLKRNKKPQWDYELCVQADWAMNQSGAVLHSALSDE